MTGKAKNRFSKWAWGVLLLLIAALILSNHFGGFVELGVWSIIATVIALLLIVSNIATLSFASLPIPLAILYYVFQIPLDFPFIRFWILAPVTLLATIALHILLPKPKGSGSHYGIFGFDGIKYKHSDDDWDDDDWDDDRDDADDFDDGSTMTGGDAVQVEKGNAKNNPRISVSFGEICRYLHADRLETVRLECSFGSLEVYFDQAQLSPGGAEVSVSCNFGSVELFVPRHWRIIHNMSATLGSAEVNGSFEPSDENAPTLTVTGNVSFGSIEVNRIKR